MANVLPSGSTVVRLLGVSLPVKQKIGHALTRVYGIGMSTSKQVCDRLGLNPNTRVGHIPPDMHGSLRDTVENNYTTRQDLQKKLSSEFQKLIDVGSWKSIRHQQGLPVRGQRTQTNATTARKLAPRRAGFLGVKLTRLRPEVKKGPPGGKKKKK